MKHKGQSVFYHNFKHKEESENMTHQSPRYFWQTLICWKLHCLKCLIIICCIPASLPPTDKEIWYFNLNPVTDCRLAVKLAICMEKVIVSLIYTYHLKNTITIYFFAEKKMSQYMYWMERLKYDKPHWNNITIQHSGTLSGMSLLLSLLVIFLL